MSRTGPEGLPWPDGEPGALLSAAAGTRRIGQRLSSAAAAVNGGWQVWGWSGNAAGRYQGTVNTQQASIKGAAEVYGSVAAALAALGTLLDTAQTEIRALGRQVRAAREEAERLQAAAARARSRAAATDAFSPLGVAVPAQAEALAAGAAAGAAQAEYERVRSSAQKQARELVEQCEAADAATAGEVGEAKVAATAGPGGTPAPPDRVDIDPAALAWTYAVHLRFHPDEKINPADLDAALSAGVLRRHADGSYYIDLPANLREGVHAPVTYNIVDRDGKQYIVYRIFYGSNNKGPDDHAGDLELFSVELDRNGRPAAALYYSHGAPFRIPWDQVAKQGTHPVEYVASGSHAGYPAPGHYKIGTTHAGPVTIHTATDEAADGGRRSDTEGNLGPGRDRYPFPKGTQIGGTQVASVAGQKVGASPQAPNSGANAEPFPAGSHPQNGTPPRGDGIDGVPRQVIDTGKDALKDVGDFVSGVL
jgi:hypothetical protein